MQISNDIEGQAVQITSRNTKLFNVRARLRTSVIFKTNITMSVLNSSKQHSNARI